MINRRLFLVGSSAFGMSIATRALADDQAPVFWGPPATPAIILAYAIHKKLIEDIVPGATFKVWKTPDEMRAGTAGGAMQVVVVPTYVAANFYNKGMGLRLANVLTDGLLYLVAKQDTVHSLKDLKGKRLVVPFKNDMPDFILQQCLAAASINAQDIAIQYVATPPEALQMLMMGRADAALLGEPAVSAAIIMASLKGTVLTRALDLQALWLSSSGHSSLPQAGLAVSNAFFKKYGKEGIHAINTRLRQALDMIKADPDEAAEIAALAIGFPASILGAAVSSSRLTVTPAQDARNDLEALFKILATRDARIIGDRLPDEGFYL